MEEEKKPEKYYQMRAKEVIDSMFDCKVFKDTITRDDMQGHEDLVAYLMQSNADTARKIAEFNFKFKK